MGMAERVIKRLEKEEAERQRRWEAEAPEREKRYVEIDKKLDEHSRLREADPYGYPEDARRLMNHIADEHFYDFLAIYTQFRKGKIK
jgi:hypothetical protein